MSWEKWQKNGKKLSNSIVEPFYILTSTLLTLLLPLSFLLLSRLSIADYLFSQTQPYSISIFFFFRIIPIILDLLVSLITTCALVHALTGLTTPVSLSSNPIFQLPICISWFFLYSFQVCVGLGTQASFSIGINGPDSSHKISLISKILFFLGLHETMTFWSRAVVKPVVDDTILGFRKEERWPERAAVAAGLGGLWWWRLRSEIELLVIILEIKKKLNMGVGVCDVIGWLLFYLTVTIGIVKFAKLVMCFAVILLFNKVELPHPGCESYNENDEKV